MNNAMQAKKVTGKVRQKNKALIFQAAKKEFVAHGYKGTSIKRIAEIAQIPRANIHYYFTDKADLYRQLLNEILDLWNTHYDSLDANALPEKALSDYIRSKVMFSKNDPDASRIFASEIIHGAPLLKGYLDSDFKKWVQNKVVVIEGWIQKGQIDAINPYHLLFMIWGATQHYADFNVQVLSAMNTSSLTALDYEAIVKSLTAIILKGCGIKN